MMMFFLEKNMKKWKIGISVMLVLCIFMLTACGSKKSVDNKSTQNAGDCITVSIPESFESLSGMNADNLMDYLKTNGDGNYEELKIADGLVKISVTEEQANYWKNYAKDKVDAQLSTLTNVSSKYSASCSDSFDVINVYYDTIISFKEAFAYVGKTAIYCALYQLFNGQKDYTITLDVYNVDTGKLVAGGNLEKDDVSYGDTEWKASYILDDKEAGELESKYEDEGEVIDIKSSFIDDEYYKRMCPGYQRGEILMRREKLFNLGILSYKTNTPKSMRFNVLGLMNYMNTELLIGMSCDLENAFDALPKFTAMLQSIEVNE